MPLIATLVSNPKDRRVSVPLANIASRAAGASAVHWLAEDVACDLVLPETPDIGELTANLRAALASEPVDIIVQPAEGRRKRILLADMDSTMINQECIDELADEIGVKDRVAAITARSMNGEIAFEPALRERVALLKGLDTAVVDRILANRLTLAAGGRALVQTMRANGAWTALVSGGFDVFTNRIAAMLGFQENRANRLIEDGGRFTGTVAAPILGRAAKAEALLDIAARLGVTTQDAVAVGDGANDLDMIRLAGTGVALHAKPAVAEQARIRIDHGDLTALLYLQGYRQDEFVQ
ncbi:MULTISPECIES: phosphoserine phosphatase SerB [unclassified Mesorhizobium]|uniref:phosphoserine phosphatase SerB n=1 Tax=unclassified Mesorhizobium TaxID=325217 RepID=UPI000BB02BD8|nr:MULTISPECIES: phosphoserine phosphatase SerB [unclassified Mesorhizobium]MDG4903312.1 phosphoserine phosphatase SerB [Mesorhizobium sp. WSM4962]MDG4919946.1 phosphoserine phosphatase SerB [Mesorhizobium sp. WSM4989]PBB31707.1 phosphoserine phosphatase SerB [Mesorhizobium sp. WSM3882]PBB40274.1 phosphoserine phosphatase SerB [Mesorhizobium sp. WSM3866]RUU97741.1 phosphoserine phosphatase SerB [Mesorhizobium sp. M1A.F.Ca.IN.020.03.2.1]